MTEKDIWNERSIEALEDIKTNLKTLRQKVNLIYEHEKTAPTIFLNTPFCNIMMSILQ